MQRAVQRPGDVDLTPGPPEQPRRRVVVFQGLEILAADEQDVADRSQALRPAAGVIEFFGHPSRRVRQPLGPLHVEPRQPHDVGIQALNDGRLPELLVLAKKARPRPQRC